MKPEKSGKEESKRLRKTGYVRVFFTPHGIRIAFIKNSGKGTLSFLSDKKHSHGIIDLKIKTDKARKLLTAVIKDFQYDSLKKKINHFDFYGVSMKEKITLVVPLILEGEPKGVKEGGILDISLREIEVECFPADDPGAITIDISEMGFNDVITLQDIVLPEEVKLITDIDRTIASVVAPTKVEEEVPEEEAEEAAEGTGEEAADKAKAHDAKSEEHKGKE